MEEQTVDDLGTMRCPSCKLFFHPHRTFPWHWVIIGSLCLMGLLKTIVDPVTPIDARAGWHLRHD